MITKTLYLIRHGKAEDHSFFKKDYDRNLVDKGIERSLLISIKLKLDLQKENLLVISSSANRAIQTAKIYCEEINYPIQNIQLENGIYEAYYTEILKVINNVEDHIDTVLVFGHNPGLSDLTNYLCDSIISLKTSHVAKITLPKNFNFKEISGSTCYLAAVITE